MNSRPDQAVPVPVQPRVTCVPRSGASAAQPAPAAGDNLEAWATALTGLLGQLAGSWPQPALDYAAPARPSWRRVPFPLAGRLAGN